MVEEGHEWSEESPLLWFLELQRSIYSLGGDETFECTLFRVSTGTGDFILVLVCVDDLLIASRDPESGEAPTQRCELFVSCPMVKFRGELRQSNNAYLL